MLPADALRSPHATTAKPLLIRASTADDLPAIAAIYAEAVLHGTATFEIDPPDVAEMARRRDDVLAKALPWLVATAGTAADARVIGYAYATVFRPRPAYRYSLENSVYIDAGFRGQGAGRLLMAELLANCEAQGARQILAVIGDSANAASIGLHAALGFQPVGTFKNVGRKFDRWLDVVLMQRSLGTGAATAPHP